MRVFDLLPIVRFNKVVTAKINLTVNLTQEGILKPSTKMLYIFDDIYSRLPLVALSFKSAATAHVTVGANAISGNRVILAYDYEEPKWAVIRTVSINQDLILNIDLNDGAGGGGSTEPTDPATAPAVIRVNKQPAIREVLAVEKRTDGTWRFAGNTLISKTGDLELQVTGGEVYAIGVDDFGIPYQAGLELELGQTVRPTLFQGWLYECTEVGQLPGTEPTWWPEEGENPPRLVGTARLQAVRYYQPIAHGPIHYELI